MPIDILLQATNRVQNYMYVWDKLPEDNLRKSIIELVCSVIQHRSVILNKARQDGGITKRAVTKKLSKRLWRCDLEPSVVEFATQIIKQFIGTPIISFDEGDIAKPYAKSMEWVGKIRDGSKHEPSVWYNMRTVDVNGFPLLVEVDKPVKKPVAKNALKNSKKGRPTGKKWKKNTVSTVKYTEPIWFKKKIAMIKKTVELIGHGIWLIDRWWDDTKLFQFFSDASESFVIRAKTNRIVTDLATGKSRKINTFKPWSYKIQIPKTKIVLQLHVVQHGDFKEPMRMYTNYLDDAKACLELYLKRRSVEIDYKKMKEVLWLEDVRLLQFMKVKNIVAIVQYGTIK